MHLLHMRCREFNFPIDLQVQTILPIAFYRCEIWEFEDTRTIEKLQHEFRRFTTNSKKSTPM